jgi:hypothetical protein
MLYGVTMEEHGVSKLVGVRFEHSNTPVTHAPSVAETFGKHGNLTSEQTTPEDPTASLHAAFAPIEEEETAPTA